MVIRILYEVKSDVTFRHTFEQSRVKPINEAPGISLEVTYVSDRDDFYRRLQDNPSGYDIAVVHMSSTGKIRNAFSFADEIRRRIDFPGKLIGESLQYPADQETVLEYFDHYTDLLPWNDNLQKLLKDLGYLPEDFHLP